MVLLRPHRAFKCGVSLLSCALAATFTNAVGPATAQVAYPQYWVTDGAVNAVARNANTIYIGGTFTMVGPPNGAGVPVDAVTGAAIQPVPRVAGQVRAAVPDGSGGWYIGG